MEGTEILLKGLQNKGENNCFINVVVQILWNIPETRNQLLSQTHVHENPTPCITCEISVISTQNLFVNMKYSALKTFSTQHLREVLSTVATLQTDFLLNNMGCAIETFEEILDILHQESLPNCSESCITHKYFSIQFCEEV